LKKGKLLKAGITIILSVASWYYQSVILLK